MNQPLVVLDSAAPLVTGDARRGRRSDLAAALVRATRLRAWPLAATAVLLTVGMATSFLYLPVHRHVSAWFAPGDLWATFQASHFIAWGDLGGVYSSSAHLVSLPGFPLLAAPLAWVAWRFNLSESWPLTLPHPTAWLLIGPFSFLAAGVALLGADALAERFWVRGRSRAVLAFAGAALLLPVVLVSGHPEDPLALGLSFYALRAGLDGRWTASAWTCGAAIAVQPVSVLFVPALLGAAGARRAVPFLARAASVPALLVGVVLAADWGPAYQALFRQPNYPGPDHPTPWVALAPRLSPTSVAAGPGRIVAVVLAVGLGLWVAKRGRHRETVLVAGFLAVAARPVFESVLNPYYATPALVLALLLAARRGPARTALAGALGLALTVLGYFHMGEWAYWSLVVGFLTAVALAGLAGRPRTGWHGRIHLT